MRRKKLSTLCNELTNGSSVRDRAVNYVNIVPSLVSSTNLAKRQENLDALDLFIHVQGINQVITG